MDKNLSWEQWKREKTLGMPRCSESQMANRIVGTSKGVFIVGKNGW